MAKINNISHSSQELLHSLGNLGLVNKREEQVSGLPGFGASMGKHEIKILMVYLVEDIIHFLIGEFLIREPTPTHHLAIFLINRVGSTDKEATLAIDIESKITPKTKAVIVNSPNNPSGVVYSEEKPQPSRLPAEYGKHVPASLSFVPSAMGLIMAGRIVSDLSEVKAQF